MSAQVLPLTRQPDNDVGLAQRGDANAFDRLYEAHVGRVYALCLRLTADRYEAELLTQDVFVRVWQQLPTFRGESAFSTWVHRLAVNVALTELRSGARRGARVMLVDDTDRVSDARVPYIDNEQRIDLERAIATLPAGARLVLVLHDVEGYTHEEIAELSGNAVGTTKAQLHRARKLLRERLKP